MIWVSAAVMLEPGPSMYAPVPEKLRLVATAKLPALKRIGLELSERRVRAVQLVAHA